MKRTSTRATPSENLSSNMYASHSPDQPLLQGVQGLRCPFTETLGIVECNPSPAEPGYTLPLQNSVDPDQLASEEAN